MVQYQIFIINLDPTVGHEIKKIRPCVIVSPDEMNVSLRTVIIVPVTSEDRKIPTRVYLNKKNTGFKEVHNWAVLDQIRTVDKKRLIKPIGHVSGKDSAEISRKLLEMFALQ